MKDGVRIRELQLSDSFTNFPLAPEDERLEFFLNKTQKNTKGCRLRALMCLLKKNEFLGLFRWCVQIFMIPHPMSGMPSNWKA